MYLRMWKSDNCHESNGVKRARRKIKRMEVPIFTGGLLPRPKTACLATSTRYEYSHAWSTCKPLGRLSNVHSGTDHGNTVFDKHLNDNNNNRRPCRLTKLHWKFWSRSIKSPTVLDIGNTGGLRGRYKNVTGRLRGSFRNSCFQKFSRTHRTALT